MPTELLTCLLVLLGTLLGNLVSFAIQRMIIKGEKSNYISKVRFDKEFEIYQELSEKNLDMVYCCIDIEFYYNNYIGFLPNMLSSESGIKEELDKYNSKINEADISNKKYAPFIDRKIYDYYNLLVKEAKNQHELLYLYQLIDSWGTIRFDNVELNKDEAVKKINENKQKISDLSDKILDELREYLKSLDVKEK